MPTALPAAPEMLPLAALNGVAPFESRLMPAPELLVDETASNVRFEAVFALRTSTAGPPVALTFSVEPEPTLIVGARAVHEEARAAARGDREVGEVERAGRRARESHAARATA